MTCDFDVENTFECLDAITAASCYLECESDNPGINRDDLMFILKQSGILYSLAIDAYTKAITAPSTTPVKESSDNEVSDS